METEYRLDTSVTATIAAAGTAQASIGPTLPQERWHIEIMSASGPNKAKLEVFRGTFKVDGTDRADNDTSSTDITVQTGETLTFKWTNGVLGSVMLCALTGSRFVPGRRAY